MITKHRFLFFLSLLSSFAIIKISSAATYSYDAAGRYNAITYPNGQVFYYRYDQAGNLLEVTTDLIPPADLPPQVNRRAGSESPVDTTAGNPMGAHTYGASGLPPGWRIDPTTGIISGRLTARPGSYTISYWSQAGRQRSETKTFLVNVAGFPSGMLGSYEALLLDPESGAPAGKLEIVVSGLGAYSGRLMESTGITTPVRGVLLLSDSTPGAEARAALPSAPGQVAREVAMTFTEAGTLTASLREGFRAVATSDPSSKLPTYTRQAPAAWQGTYTMAVSPATWRPEVPDGAGYASVRIAETGVMSLAGKLADGTKWTASARSGGDRSYILFQDPHRRAGSYVAGVLNLDAQAGGGYAADTTTDSFLLWRKMPGARDAGYRVGFGPAELDPILLPWTRPANLASSLGLGAEGEFGASISGGGLDSTGLNLPPQGASALPADTFANATPISASGGVVLGNNLRATKETGETNHAFNAGGASVWWQWTPTTSGSAILETTGSDFDTLLAVYTGTAVNALVRINSNDNASGGVVTSGLTFNATAGTTYYIVVDGKQTGFGENATVARGNIRLGLTPTQPNGRPNYYGIPAALRLAGTSIQTAENSRSRLTGTVNPATGVFQASFEISDIDWSTGTPKAIRRRVVNEGVLLQNKSGDIGSGFFNLPPLAKGGEIYSGQVIFTKKPQRSKYPD